MTVLRLSGGFCRSLPVYRGHDSEEIERLYIRPQFSDIAGAMEVLPKGLSASV